MRKRKRILLLAEIYKIKAIDNHAHPLKYVAEGEKPDDEFDALPLDAIELFPLPVRLNPGIRSSFARGMIFTNTTTAT